MKSVVILLLLQFTCALPIGVAQSQTGNDWERSFQAGLVDESTGKPFGGTEIVHLVAHKGRLYAGNGYWMDTRGYAKIPWSQVLVLETNTWVKTTLPAGHQERRSTQALAIHRD